MKFLKFKIDFKKMYFNKKSNLSIHVMNKFIKENKISFVNLIVK